MESKKELFSPIPTGEHRSVASFNVNGCDGPTGIKHELEVRAGNTPLRFDVEYFRHPERGADGRWNCRWIERYDVTDSMGIRKKDDWGPARAQFNMRYLSYRLQMGEYHPLLKTSFRDAFPDMPDSPEMTHVELLYDVLGLETARRDNLLTADRSEAEPGLYAIVEHSTGAVIPISREMRVDFIAEGDAMMTIRAKPVPVENTYHSLNGHERYGDGQPDDGDWFRTMVDIGEWSRQLRRLIDAAQWPQFAGWRKAVAELEERTKQDDECNGWND